MLVDGLFEFVGAVVALVESIKERVPVQVTEEIAEVFEEKIEGVPVPQMKEDGVDVLQFIPQERVNRTLEQIVALVPQIKEDGADVLQWIPQERVQVLYVKLNRDGTTRFCRDGQAACSTATSTASVTVKTEDWRFGVHLNAEVCPDARVNRRPSTEHHQSMAKALHAVTP